MSGEGQTSMWRAIFSFEIRYHLRQPLFYVAAAFLFALGALLMTSDLGVALGDVPANADRNAPILIIRHLTIFALVGLFLITAYVTSSVLRDFERDTYPLFFSKPIRKFDYLMGRFAGSMTISLAAFLVTAVGLLFGQFAPWQDSEHVGAFRVAPYLFGLLVLVLPNLLSMGAILFAVAVWSRRRLVVYLGVIVYLFVQDFVEELVMSFNSDVIASVVEPTGLVALKTVTRYWTVAETNVALPDLMGPILLNRLLWLGLGLGILALGYWRFSTSRAAQRSARRAVREQTAIKLPSPIEANPPGVSRRIVLKFVWRTPWRQWLSQTRLETGQILNRIPFLILFVLGVTFVFSMAAMVGEDRNTSVLPLTHFMLRAIRINMQMFLMIVVVLYAGELVWRERTSRLDGVFDSLPTAGWVYPGAKLAALVVVTAIFVGAGILATVAYQLISGFHSIEPGLYARGALVAGVPFVLLAVVSLFLQVVAKNKFVGFLLVIALIVWRRFAPTLGLEHHLFVFGGRPTALHSDMNGYGHYASPYFWFSLHGGFAAAILLVLSVLLWVRGAERSFRNRVAQARARWSGGIRIVTAVAVVGWVATGTLIYYNTNVLNEYVPRGKRLQRRADYEIKYGEYRGLTMPRITSVRADIDIYPRERRVEIRGSYRLENKSEESIRMIPVSTSGRSDAHNYLPFGGRVEVNRIDLPNHTVLVADEEYGFYVYQLEEALAPGQTMDFGFDVTAKNRGFKNRRQDQRIVGNGTFFANKNLFPDLGYAQVEELVAPKDRRDHGLPPAPRTAGIEDVSARDHNYLGADWTQYETTVSTCAGQIAVGPGHLEKQWVEGDRSYFHYKTGVPMINFAVFASAEYEVARDNWNDVAIEIYYHPKHPFNIGLLIDTTKESLDYFTAAFGPYPHSKIRIIEVPNYIGRTAFSLAHTIPYSESWGFVTRESGRVIDMNRYVTAHEIAHQWWNHQVVPADVQGATMIAEGLATYSGLMVMKKMYGAENMGGFLDYERDTYLDRRGLEEIEEMPLLLVENQPYIHYGKAALVFYALQDYIGEDTLNEALRRFLEAESFAGPPYTTSVALLDYIRDVVPEELDYLIEDMFETITLFDNRITGATCSKKSDDVWEVTIQTSVRKLRSDGRGVESEIPVDDWIDIAVFGEEERDGEKQTKILYMDKRRITGTDMTFGISVEGEPVRVAIDPYHKHIDRVFKDNVRSVTTISGP